MSIDDETRKRWRALTEAAVAPTLAGGAEGDKARIGADRMLVLGEPFETEDGDGILVCHVDPHICREAYEVGAVLLADLTAGWGASGG